MSDFMSNRASNGTAAGPSTAGERISAAEKTRSTRSTHFAEPSSSTSARTAA
nr:hypothetical protein [Actinoplanes durhamensis]